MLHSVVTVLFAGVLLGSSVEIETDPGKDQDLFNQGKVLMFDKKWEAARGVFQRVIREHPGSPLLPQAHYFSARTLQLEGKEAEALRAYEEFLQRFPNEAHLDPFLPAEARNAVVELAASLVEKGNTSYKDRVSAGLVDPRKDVRYFTAVRASYLADRRLTSQAVPILREIVEKEKERDLVDRAKLALLRIDPNSLGAEQSPAAKGSRPEGRLFHLVIFEEGQAEPKVELKLPMSLAELALSALSEEQKKKLRLKDFDIDNVWESLRRLGATDILTIRDGKNLVKIWIE
jgi:tetratricopeptide (TPR) repeat protein